jgi:hypothetical protein
MFSSAVVTFADDHNRALLQKYQGKPIHMTTLQIKNSCKRSTSEDYFWGWSGWIDVIPLRHPKHRKVLQLRNPWLSANGSFKLPSIPSMNANSCGEQSSGPHARVSLSFFGAQPIRLLQEVFTL